MMELPGMCDFRDLDPLCTPPPGSSGSAMSSADGEVSRWLELSAPYFGDGPGGDVLWPLVGMGTYAVMVTAGAA